MKATDLKWGLKEHGIEAPALWGARCILEEWRNAKGVLMQALDVVWDRQAVEGDVAERQLLTAALDGRDGDGALDQFRQWIAKRGSPQSVAIEKVQLGGVRFYFSTRRSAGYLYVTAHLVPEDR